MKMSIAFLVVVLWSLSVVSLKAQYTFGVPVDDTLAYAGANTDTCYPNPNIFFSFPLSTITGVDYYFEFNVPANDSIIANGITYYSGIHSVLINGAMITYRPSDSTTSGVIKAIGTPQIANQPYLCGDITIISSGTLCPTSGDYNFFDTCYVQPASSIQNVSDKNLVFIYQFSPGIFKIKAAQKILKQVLITDGSGRMVFSSSNNFSEINLTNFSPGIYFYAITDEKENVFRGRIVKE